MDRLLSWLCAMILAGGIVWGWDRHAPAHYVLPWWTGHMHMGLPDSLATERDQAQQAARASLVARNACLAQVGSQNASIALLSRESAAKLAQATKAEADAKAVAASLLHQAADLSSYEPKGSDECSRFEDADRKVVEDLQ